jgi:lipoate---protein ligase
MQFAWTDAPERDPAAQLSLDEELLAEGRGVLRTWETAGECVVLGRAGRPERDLHVEACQKAGVPVLRRNSGGGAVVLGPGCLNYSLVLPLTWNPRWQDVRYSFAWAMDWMRRALALSGLRLEGDCDLAFHGRKVSGNAQRRTRDAILHHGTLLYEFDAGCAERFLKPPHREPHYRAGRTHRDFLGNLPVAADELRQRLRAACL